MRRTTFLLLLLAALTVWAAPVSAIICDIDEVPAATLLLPYFETDLVTPGLSETIIVIRNADKVPKLANMVVWSDVGVPVFSIPIGLKAYGTYSFSFYDVLTTGNVPPSERGSFPKCTGLLPVPTIAPSVLKAVQNALTGQPVVSGGQCVGLALPGRPNAAHGYVTVDTVRECTLLFPGDTGYFLNGGTGIATNDNKLLGQSLYRDSSVPMAHDEPLVHIEAGTFAKGDYTFYGRLVGWSGDDEREPLATNFGVGFAQSGFFGTTELIVWRDPRKVQAPFACATPPAKLGQTAAVSFDEDGVPTTLPRTHNYFTAAAQRVDLVASGLRPAPPASGDFGWFFLNLGHRLGTPPTSTQRLVAQGWVFGMTNSAAPAPIYMGSFEATRLDSACKGKAKPNAPLPKLP